jgi:DNA polymerase-3 subunit delta'
VIRGAAYRPFEGERRVFVIEAAEAMADESQNALLKTLEEPADFVHLILLSAEPAALLETVVSRCQEVRFAPLAGEVVAARLAAEGAVPGPELEAVSRLCGGDVERARFLLSEAGRGLRRHAEACARAARAGRAGGRPWVEVLDAAGAAGAEAAERVRASVELATEGIDPKEARRRRREAEDAAKRAARARRTEALDLALALSGAWFRDLAAVAEGGADLVLNADRADQLRDDAEGLDPAGARRAAELVLETRRNLQVNVSEELALEGLFFKAEVALR